MKELIFIVAILVSIPASSALSCFCDPERICQTPTCCASGYLFEDVCRCCFVCAKPEGEACGGLWGMAGFCAKGMRCLTKCNGTNEMDCQLTEGVCLQAAEAENIYEQLQQKNETVILSGYLGSGQTQIAFCGQPGGDVQPNQAML